MMNDCRTPNGESGFTLVEMLIVMALIGILVAMLLPAVQAVREAAWRTSCQSHLSQLAAAAHNYEMTFGYFPQGVVAGGPAVTNEQYDFDHSWTIPLLPFIEQGSLFSRVDRTVSVYDPQNLTWRQRTIELYVCPSSTTPPAISSYAACYGDTEGPITAQSNGAFILNVPMRHDDITDGASQTIFFGEKLARFGDLGWMSGTSATMRNTAAGPNAAPVGRAALFGKVVEPWSPEFQPKKFATGRPAKPSPMGGFASHHPGGAQFAIGDGSVQFIVDTINAATYARLGNRADAQLIGDF